MKFAVKIEFMNNEGKVIDWHQFGSGITKLSEVVEWLANKWNELK